jgi:DNA repair protein RecN (Recombination protein N)
VLVELRVENLLLIEAAELRLDPGLNVITGETGAGKTVLAHALDLLLGGKPRRGILRPGADDAYVEGVFEAASGLGEEPELAELAERVPLDAGELVLARRVTADGRSRAYLGGRSVAAADLRAVGTRLLAFYGQHEHRKLTLASTQLEVLDGYCGADHLAARATFEREWREARRLQRELEELRERVSTRERDLELLEFELGEIEAAAPTEEEEEELEAERARLSAVDLLKRASWGAATALDRDGDEGESGAGLLARAGSELSAAEGADPALDALAERARTIAYEAQDLAGELRDYARSLEADPARLEQVTERIDLLTRLGRKHGGTISAVLDHARNCRREIERLQGAGETTARVERELDDTLKHLSELAARLHTARKKAASGLERSVREALRQLAMADASFAVTLGERPPDPSAGALGRLGPLGADTVEFTIAPNRGVPAGRLREIASGGELSRVMLALLGAAASGEGSPTVVFDEIDAGVGGNTAHIVGQKLRSLAGDRQVICITHLPQVASLAGRHFRVVKDSEHVPARATVDLLREGEVVAELCRMLGADAGDRVARRLAESLLQAA